MGLFPKVQELIRIENDFLPLHGDVLLIGRQDVYGTPAPMTDVEFFHSISPDLKVRAIDVNDFEGAELVWDMCEPVPTSMHRIADFIFDGSCLDNIFDAPAALRNMHMMLRPGGRIMLMEHGTAIKAAYTCFSPEWFFGFFAANGYADCQIKLGCFTKVMDFKTWTLRDWVPYDSDGKLVKATPNFGKQPGGQPVSGDFYNIVLAEKHVRSPNWTVNPTLSVNPVQGQYRLRHDPSSDLPYQAAHQRFMASARRFV